MKGNIYNRVVKQIRVCYISRKCKYSVYIFHINIHDCVYLLHLYNMYFVSHLCT